MAESTQTHEVDEIVTMVTLEQPEKLHKLEHKLKNSDNFLRRLTTLQVTGMMARLFQASCPAEVTKQATQDSEARPFGK
ncbi:hypothetical protein CHS0354_021643 [Potamilus streckersoni]|uniref:Uncharacterized protein n=1 Tax=Potamilus streckersoni TaxID=2493646 RepID=A0AAE0SQ33_9BIVA|nr:hypothetical protein CHS0354_021643 [Potamilus streckersoni]